MNKSIVAFVGAACLLCTQVVQATPFKLDFTVSGFNALESSFAAPHDNVTGSILFSAKSLGAPITSIDGIDLSIGGHVYTPAEVGGATFGGGYIFGGKLNGVFDDEFGTNDFALFLGSFKVMYYTVEGIDEGWNSRAVTARYTNLSAVPEPGMLAMWGLGGAALWLARRRRNGAA